MGRPWLGLGDTGLCRLGRGRGGKSWALFTILTAQAAESLVWSEYSTTNPFLPSQSPKLTSRQSLVGDLHSPSQVWGHQTTPTPTLRVMLQPATLPLPHITLNMSSKTRKQPDYEAGSSRGKLRAIHAVECCIVINKHELELQVPIGREPQNT